MVKQEQLILYLSAQLSRVTWIVMRAGVVIKEANYLDHSQTLTADAKDREIIIIVPAEDVLLTSVSLPTMRGNRLNQAIPFALEENLVAEIETLHFAYGKQEETGCYPVAVVAKEKMKQWLELLSSWHIVPDIMIPLTLALPVTEHAWSFLIDEGICVRRNSSQGFFCDETSLKNTLSATDLLDLPQQFIVYNGTSISLQNKLKKLLEDREQKKLISFTTQSESMSLDIQEEMVPVNQLLAYLAPMMTASPINLLQNDFALRKSHFPRREKVWKVALGLALFSALLIISYPVVSYFILAPRLNQLTQQIEKIYRVHFPQAVSVVAPKFRMQEKLKKLTHQGGEDHLFIWLLRVSQGIKMSPTIHLKRLEFQNNQLSVELVGNSSEEVTAFTDFLQQQGLKVRQQSAHLIGARMNTTLMIDSF